MPPIPKAEPSFMGVARVYSVPSSTRSKTHYVLVFDNENGRQCTCEGFQYNRTCKHVLMDNL